MAINGVTIRDEFDHTDDADRFSHIGKQLGPFVNTAGDWWMFGVDLISALTNFRAWKSTDGGVTWTQAANQSLDGIVSLAAVQNRADADEVFLLYHRTAGNGIRCRLVDITSTGSFGTDENVESEIIETDHGICGETDSTGKLYCFYTCDEQTAKGGSYEQVRWSERSTGGTWTNNGYAWGSASNTTNSYRVTDAIKAQNDNRIIVVCQVANDSNGDGLEAKVINTSGTLQSATTINAIGDLGGKGLAIHSANVSSYIESSTDKWTVWYVDASTADITYRTANVADSPSWGTAQNTTVDALERGGGSAGTFCVAADSVVDGGTLYHCIMYVQAGVNDELTARHYDGTSWGTTTISTDSWSDYCAGGMIVTATNVLFVGIADRWTGTTGSFSIEVDMADAAAGAGGIVASRRTPIRAQLVR